MSRFIKNPVLVPDGVEVTIEGDIVRARGPAGAVERCLGDRRLSIVREEDGLRVSIRGASDLGSRALAGSYWRLLFGMMSGAKNGAEKILELVGVGYRAQVEGDEVRLSLGFSHPVRYALPAGVSAVAPSQTEIIIKGADKALVGQTAADIRAFRPPEPYKGKGVRYRGERVIMKEAKKK